MSHGLRVQTTTAVRRTNQRTSHDAGKAHFLGSLGVLDKFFRLDPPLDGMVPRRGTQVLGDGEDVTARGVQVSHRLGDLFGCLTHAEDQVGLGDQAVFTGSCDDVEAALVPECGTDALEDAGDGLEVVCEHLGREAKTSSSSSGLPLKSGTRFSTPVPGLSSWILRTVSA